MPVCQPGLNFLVRLITFQEKLKQTSESFKYLIFSQDSSDLVAKMREDTGVLF